MARLERWAKDFSTMNNFTPPSKEEIKRCYGITNDDFEILVQDSPTPPPRFSLIDTVIEPLASFFGVPTFAFKRGVFVVALIFVPWWGPIAKKNFEDCIVTTTEYYFAGFRQLPPPKDQDDIRYVVTVPPAASTTPIMDLRTGMFSSGTQFHLISGSATIPS